jgi:hypothetical protein
MTSQGRLNAEVLNALGSNGEWIEFYEVTRRVQEVLPGTLSGSDL